MTFIFRLTNSQSLFGENRLFATLDTTTHHATLPSNNKCILVDTIGFISNLPIQLFASFSATLQHVANAVSQLKTLRWPKNLKIENILGFANPYYGFFASKCFGPTRQCL